MKRAILILGLLIGFALTGYAVRLMNEDPESSRSLEREEFAIEGTDVGEISRYDLFRTEFRIHNNSDAPIRFVGGSTGCWPGGCTRTIGPCPKVIEPRSTCVVPLEVTIDKEGKFELAIAVYLEVDSMLIGRQAVLTGTGVDSEKAVPDLRSGMTE